MPKAFDTDFHSTAPQDPERAQKTPGLQHWRSQRPVLWSSSPTGLLAVRIVRGAQILLNLVLLVLSATLLSQATTRLTHCNALDNVGEDSCSTQRRAVGVLKYCLFPACFGTAAASIGIFATFTPVVWPVLTIVLDNLTGGFSMGAGCSIAAMMNVHPKPCAVWGGSLCDGLFAAMATFFTAVVLAYSMSIRTVRLRNRSKRGNFGFSAKMNPANMGNVLLASG
ncbi:hypothetical protein LTR74_013274 [Friedmanniomyces endolithicus]|nr:hypothetical protein LTR74_013274 [Friedmanniomyces endolithicus]